MRSRIRLRDRTGANRRRIAPDRSSTRFSRCRSARLSPRHFLPLAVGTALLLGCVSGDPPPREAIRLGALEFQGRRLALEGQLATLSGFLISAGFTGDDICLKILVDDELRAGPDLMIARRGRLTRPTIAPHSEDAIPGQPEPKRESVPQRDWFASVLPGVFSVAVNDAWMSAPRPGPAAEPVSPGPAPARRPPPPTLRSELELAEAYLASKRSAEPGQRAVVVHACKRPPTRANKKAALHALEWLEPLKKPDRVTRAPTLQALRRELQLFYLERSRNYDWTELEWAEVTLTGTLLGREARFEDEVMGGVDMIPYVVGVHDPHRRSWLFIDLTFDDSVTKEVVFKLLGDQADLFKRAGKAALKGGLP